MLFRRNVIEKSFMNWRVLTLVKINTRISETPCIKKLFTPVQIKKMVTQKNVH
jgi:hypothetical protein